MFTHVYIWQYITLGPVSLLACRRVSSRWTPEREQTMLPWLVQSELFGGNINFVFIHLLINILFSIVPPNSSSHRREKDSNPRLQRVNTHDKAMLNPEPYSTATLCVSCSHSVPYCWTPAGELNLALDVNFTLRFKLNLWRIYPSSSEDLPYNRRWFTLFSRARKKNILPKGKSNLNLRVVEEGAKW
jgi:hypothetical protein